MSERKGDWMQTFTGRQYWPLDPRASEVDIVDIAHHLSMICRYCGACSRFYSVAEHSVGVLYVVGRQRLVGTPDITYNVWRHALLHDAPEAYCHDLIRPIKRCVEGYAEIEGLNHDAICERFNLRGLTPEQALLIKQADNAMLLAEQAALMRPAPAKWAPIEVPADMLKVAKDWLAERGGGWTPSFAEAQFLRAAAEFGVR